MMGAPDVVVWKTAKTTKREIELAHYVFETLEVVRDDNGLPVSVRAVVLKDRDGGSTGKEVSLCPW